MQQSGLSCWKIINCPSYSMKTREGVSSRSRVERYRSYCKTPLWWTGAPGPQWHWHRTRKEKCLSLEWNEPVAKQCCPNCYIRLMYAFYAYIWFQLKFQLITSDTSLFVENLNDNQIDLLSKLFPRIPLKYPFSYRRPWIHVTVRSTVFMQEIFGADWSNGLCYSRLKFIKYLSKPVSLEHRHVKSTDYYLFSCINGCFFPKKIKCFNPSKAGVYARGYRFKVIEKRWVRKG